MISITAHLKDGNKQQVSVDKTDMVRKLLDFLPQTHNYVIVINGAVINDCFSFQYYGIKDGDSVLVIPTTKKPEEKILTEKYAKRVDLSVQRRFMIAQGFHPRSCYELVLETTRISENFILKSQMKPALSRSVDRKFMELINDIQPVAPPTPRLVTYDAPVNPSTEALPSFW